MTTTFDDKEIHQDTDEEALRRLLGLGPARTVVYDDGELIERCPECGHWPPPIHEPVPLPPGEPVTDVVPDLSAMRAAVRTVRLLVDVLDQRRQPKQVADLAHPRVLRYLRAVPVLAGGMRGGARLLSVRPVQLHEGAVEVAGSIRLAGRRRAIAASFEPAGMDGWVCSTLRIL
jgi:hypothetical protein